MKVILKKTNEVKEVAFGYAVNYLIPQGLAVLATDQAIEKIEKQAEKKKVDQVKKSKKDKKKAEELKDKKFVIKENADKKGKLYGSLGKKELAEVIGVKKNAIILKESIKKTGNYEVELKIGEEKVKVKVKIQKTRLKKKK